MHVAVNKNYVHIVEMLLSSNYPLDFETEDGNTAFQLAAYHGHKEILELMLVYIIQNERERLNSIINKVNPKNHLSSLAYSILK